MKVFKLMTAILGIVAIASCAEYLPKGIGGDEDLNVSADAAVMDIEISSDVVEAALSEEELASFKEEAVAPVEVLGRDFGKILGPIPEELVPLDPAEEEAKEVSYLKALGIEEVQKVKVLNRDAKVNDVALKANEEIQVKAADDGKVTLRIEGACNVNITIDRSFFESSLNEAIDSNETLKTAITRDVVDKAAVIEPLPGKM